LIPPTISGFARRIVWTGNFAVILLVLTRASSNAEMTPASLDLPGGIRVEPMLTATARSYYYGSDPIRAAYCLENSEGECLDEGENLFFDLGAAATVNRRLVIHYKGQFQETVSSGNSELNYRTKKAFVKLRTGIVSWEFGKDSVWIGHGHHGSLLLANNAESGLTFKFATEEPFRLPWVFSRIGRFDYLLFHSWFGHNRLFGHRLEYQPVFPITIGLSQTVFYEERFQFYEFPRILSARDENTPGRFDNDQRASIDLAIDLSFLRSFSPFIGGKIYGEQAGEDLRAFWQRNQNDSPLWPLGFKLLDYGGMLGLFLTTGSTDLRVEYAETYTGEGTWYKKFPFTNHGVLLGHHMGSDADDMFFEITQRGEVWTVRFSYDRERHGVSAYGSDAEVRNQFAFSPELRIGRCVLFGQVIHARYRNVDFNPDPLVFDIHPGTHRQETTVGLGVTVRE
jgi:hypothetical protein